MIDKATYDNLAVQLEQELGEHFRINWHTCRYNEMLGVACISDETAGQMNTTPDAHFEFTYKRMVVQFRVLIENKTLRGSLYVARALVKDAPLHRVSIIRRLAADEIAVKLVENNIV